MKNLRRGQALGVVVRLLSAGRQAEKAAARITFSPEVVSIPWAVLGLRERLLVASRCVSSRVAAINAVCPTQITATALLPNRSACRQHSDETLTPGYQQWIPCMVLCSDRRPCNYRQSPSPGPSPPSYPKRAFSSTSAQRPTRRRPTPWLR